MPNESRRNAHAAAKVTVQSSEAQPYDQSSGPAWLDIHLTQKFAGDTDGESPVRALQVLRDDHSASLVGVQRFRGMLAGREGTFVLQGSEIVEHGTIKATWFVVRIELQTIFPDCAAKAFAGEFGKGSRRWTTGLNDVAIFHAREHQVRQPCLGDGVTGSVVRPLAALTSYQDCRQRLRWGHTVASHESNFLPLQPAGMTVGTIQKAF